jgi:hypothetical protein
MTSEVPDAGKKIYESSALGSASNCLDLRSQSPSSVFTVYFISRQPNCNSIIFNMKPFQSLTLIFAMATGISALPSENGPSVEVIADGQFTYTGQATVSPHITPHSFPGLPALSATTQPVD